MTVLPRRDDEFSDPPATRLPAIRIVDASSRAGLKPPPREWLVSEMIPAGVPTLLYGDGGSGKSLLAAQLAVAVSSTGRWLGRDVKRGGVLFVSAEDDQDELDRRLIAITAAEGVGMRDLRGLNLLVLDDDPLLAHMDAARGLKPSPLYHAIERHVAATRPALVIVDTLAAVFPGDEMRRELAQAFIHMFKRLCSAYGCAVLLLAHPSLSAMASGRGASGSTGWSNAVRSRLYLQADGSDRTLSQQKNNYGPTGARIRLAWENWTLRPISAQQLADGQQRDEKACRVFLRMLDTYATEGRNVAAGGGVNFAPKVFADDRRAENFSRSKLGDAMNALMASGEIANEEFGPPSKRRNRIVRVSK